MYVRRTHADLVAKPIPPHGLYLDPSTLEPYSGPVFTTFAGSPPRIEQRVSLRDGHYDGPFEWYFGQGQLALRELYRDGTKEGPYEWYFESGRLYERGTYASGQLERPYEAYYESGDLYGTLIDGQPCGTWLEGPATITYPPCSET